MGVKYHVLTFGEECKLWEFEKKVSRKIFWPKKDEVCEPFRILQRKACEKSPLRRLRRREDNIKMDLTVPAMHDFDFIIILIVLASHGIFQDPWESQVQTVWWVQDHFPALLCDCLWYQTCSVRLCLTMLKDDSLLYQMLLTKCMLQFLVSESSELL
jgi:hypothetical protein